MYTNNQSPMYKDVPKSAEVAQYLDENRKETNRYYDKQYQHQADYSLADTDYMNAHSVKLGESPESVLIRREAYAALEKALHALTDCQRRRLLLCTEKEWSFEQIAKAEGVSADAVRHQYERTVKHLQALMEDWTINDFYPPSRGSVRSCTRRTMKNREKRRMREMEVTEGKTAPPKTE